MRMLCVDCGKPAIPQVGRGGIFKRCGPCRSEAKRRQSREGMARYRASGKGRPLSTEERREKNRRYRERYPERVRESRRRYQQSRDPNIQHGFHIKWKYGLTREQFESMEAEQGYRCAICHAAFDERPCIDHDHETGTVRGLLCRMCNVGLGYIERTPEWVDEAKAYLGSHVGEAMRRDAARRMQEAMR
jgi:hypothetical protein